MEEETDILEEFFVDYDSSIPSWDIYTVRKFFRTFQRDVTHADQHLHRAKLDARSLKSGKKRAYGQWLAPRELRQHLGVEVRDSIPASRQHHNSSRDSNMKNITGSHTCAREK